MSFSDCDIENTIVDYTIWCEKLDKEIMFTSDIIDNTEMFDLTTIASYFDINNNDITKWFTKNINLLYIIDKITIGEDDNVEMKLNNVSDSTIIKFDDKWFVNIHVLFEFIRIIDLELAHEILFQVINDFDEEHEESQSDYVNSNDDYDSEYEYEDKDKDKDN